MKRSPRPPPPPNIEPTCDEANDPAQLFLVRQLPIGSCLLAPVDLLKKK